MTELTKRLLESPRGLWHNIKAKRERGEKPAKPGEKDYPKEKTWRELTKD